MPYHETYIEPFWGRGTIAKKKLPARVTIGCDLDPAAISDGRASRATMFECCGLAFCEGLFAAVTPDIVSDDRASGTATPDPGSSAGAASSPVAISVGVGRSTAPVDRASSDVSTRAAFAPDPFVYFDPPYHEVRSYYSTKWGDSDHERLISLFLNLLAPAALSGYATRLYQDRLSGVRRIEIPTINRAGKRCVEVLWMNYDEPARYHDTRFVGEDRRERERIRRRLRNWTRGLSGLPTAERQALFTNLSDAFFDGTAGRDASFGDRIPPLDTGPHV